MKHSIRVKITFLLTALIMFTTFLYWFLNRTFLEDYYLYSKMETLGKTYEQTQKIYRDSQTEGVLSDDATIEMERLASSKNVSIYIFTDFYTYEFTSYLSSRYSVLDYRSQQLINSLVREYLFGGSNPEVRGKKLLKETDTFAIFNLYDIRMDSSYIDLVGDLESNTIFLRTNLESIQESVLIANQFHIYVGILATFVGTIIMLIVSKKFTGPILELANISKKMAELNFDVKYKVKSQDEIGELGNSINALSEKLEGTISELKKANNELLTDIQQKNEIDEMRKEFLSNVSHELKTPLSLIQGYAEGLKENINDDEESRDFYCEVIMDEADKMNKMVKKLLTLNELEFGNNQVNIERFNIIELIHDVLGSTEILFRQKEVFVRFENEEPIYVWSDKYLVEQVVTNYISNALNHVSGAKIIEIILIRRDDVVRVAVFNTGDNIKEEDLDKIWVKFYKVDKARTREYGGSGIGLSIVKAIMNSLNRECGVINRQVGVEFWFELDTMN